MIWGYSFFVSFRETCLSSSVVRPRTVFKLSHLLPLSLRHVFPNGSDTIGLRTPSSGKEDWAGLEENAR